MSKPGQTIGHTHGVNVQPVVDLLSLTVCVREGGCACVRACVRACARLEHPTPALNTKPIELFGINRHVVDRSSLTLCIVTRKMHIN